MRMTRQLLCVFVWLTSLTNGPQFTLHVCWKAPLVSLHACERVSAEMNAHPVRVNASGVCPLERERVFWFSSPVTWAWQCRSTMSYTSHFLHVPGQRDERFSTYSVKTASIREDLLDSSPRGTNLTQPVDLSELNCMHHACLRVYCAQPVRVRKLVLG